MPARTAFRKDALGHWATGAASSSLRYPKTKKNSSDFVKMELGLSENEVPKNPVINPVIYHDDP